MRGPSPVNRGATVTRRATASRRGGGSDAATSRRVRRVASPTRSVDLPILSAERRRRPHARLRRDGGTSARAASGRRSIPGASSGHGSMRPPPAIRRRGCFDATRVNFSLRRPGPVAEPSRRRRPESPGPRAAARRPPYRPAGDSGSTPVDARAAQRSVGARSGAGARPGARSRRVTVPCRCSCSRPSRPPHRSRVPYSAGIADSGTTAE